MKTLLLESVRWVNMPYTALVGLMGLYWLTVILGVLDIEVFDFDLDVDAEIEGGGGLAFLNIGAGPFSIWLSIFALQMWLYSIIFNLVVDAIPAVQLSDALRFISCSVVFIPFAAIVTKFATHPINKIFEIKSISKHQFVGKECLVTSLKVDEEFGTGEVRIEGTPQLLDIRAKPEEMLKKGDKALIFKYDAERDVFYVTNI